MNFGHSFLEDLMGYQRLKGNERTHVRYLIKVNHDKERPNLSPHDSINLLSYITMLTSKEGTFISL